jgi:tetratricopeptide (TPR) repeat protein
VLLALGKLAQELNETEKAVAAFEKIRSLAPPDTDVLEGLAKIYAATGAREKLLSVVTEVAGRATDNLAVRLQLARLYQEAGNHAKAEEWSREALFVDVSSAPAREILLAALRAQNKSAEAERIEKRHAP